MTDASASPAVEELCGRLTRCLGYLEQDQNNLSLLAEISDLYMQLAEPQHARGYIDLALAVAPNDPHVRFRLGSVDLAQGRTHEAIATFQTLLDTGVDAPGIRYNLAHALMLRKRYEESKLLLEPLAANSAETPDAPGLLVRVLHYLGDVDGAIAVAEQHLKSNPSDRTLAPMLSTLCMDANDLEAAKTWAKKALADNADNSEALATLGLLEIGEQEEQVAILHLDRAIELSPKSGRAWVGRAMGDLLSLDLAAAGERFKKAVEYMPTHIGTWHALAWCQILAGDLAGAEQSLNAAMALDHNFGETHGGLAVLAMLKGDAAKAQEFVKRAIALDPNNFSARTAQVLLLQSQGKSDVAQKLIQRAMEAPQFQDGKSLQQLVSQFVNKKNNPPAKPT